jgi:hypothetical protein
MNELVRNVVWPAVAGNVLWSFLQVAIEQPVAPTPLLPRLAALLAVGLYLAIDWINGVGLSFRSRYWKFDIPLATAIATFAIATPKSAPVAFWALGAAFSIAVVGHLNGAWDPQKKISHKSARRMLAAMNGLGLALLVGDRFARVAPEWDQAVSLTIAIGLFLALRKWVEDRWKTVDEPA